MLFDIEYSCKTEMHSFFVQCSPALGERIIEAIRERFPQKKLVRFDRTQEKLAND